MSSENRRIDVYVGRLADFGGLGSCDGPCRILLVDGLVQLDQDRRPEDIVPRGTKLEEGGPRLLVGVLEDVSEYGDHVLREQPLVRVRVVLHDRVHQVEDRQFQIGRDLVM